MALARFKALNVDSSEDSEGDEENPAITREALEEKAAAQYRNILVLQRNKKWKEAEAEFKELLDSDVLNRVSGTVNYVSGRIQPSLIHLKYCLHVNLGHVLIETGQIKEALDSYLQAVELDDRDLNLWYRIGQTAIKIPNLNLAAYALQEALQCNENHWPSLDTLITVLYAAGNYMSCLYHIAEGLKLDADFYKGIAFCQKIFKEHPSYERDFPLYYPECKLDDSVVTRDIRSEVDEEALDRIIEEAEQLRKKHVAQSSQSKQNADCNKVETIRPETPLPKRCWVAVGRTLLHVYAKLKEEYPKASFLRLVDLADEEKAETGEEKDEKKTDYDWYDADDDDNSDDEVAKLTEGGIGPGGGGSDTAMDEGGVNGSVGGGAVRASKRRRSSPSLLDQWMYSSKRRSARVRSTACGRRDEPTLARSLRELLPQYLWPSREAAWGASGDESMDTMDLYRLFESKDNGYEQMSPTNVLSYNERTKLIKEEKYFNTDKEVEDVNSFIEENNLVNILTLITNYVKTVAQKWNLHWSPALIAIYIKVYKLVRQHYPEACQSEPLDTKSANAVLVYGELLLDRWLTNGKERGAPSPLTGSVFGGDFSSLSFGNLAYFCANDVTDDEDAEFVVRCYWLEVIMYLHVKSRDAAMIALERYLADGRCCGVQVKLKNVVNNFTIDEDNVMRLYNTLKRNEDLYKVTDLFARGAQEKACAILKQCLQPSTPLLAADYVDPALDRCTQFSLLLDSLFERGLHADCLAWCELASHEALAQYRATDESSPARSRWCSLLTNTLVALPLCLEEGDSNLLERLPHWRLVRMIQTMSNVICHQMEAPADSSEIPLGTVAPWIVLYHIVKYDEEKTGRVHDEDDISASLNVLLTAHEYLGKRAWCLIDEAEILYKILGVIIPLMESSGAVTDSELVTTLCHHTEQAFYCLYGHPLKKNKPRHIIEHNAMGLALTWNRSHLVYRYFKPRELPMYDSSVRCSISQDTEALFRRIISLVPGDMDPRRQVEATSAYIEGETDRVPLKGVQLSPQVCDIYYLIADYYFKNKFWSKALRYYALDISANPSRVDSWACLALAHGSQLETKLNSCEPLSSEMDFLRSARMACKCYGRALQLDPEQSTLWIEYGSFSYMVHSFCSRLLKQEPPNLSLELFDALDKQKKQMLDQAYKCFMSANMLWTSFEKKGEPEIQDERWLHHYMFGKIALKREENPEVYLTHFMKAMRYLHKNHAKYPNTVSYSNPQLYCIEALELYYRVHACVLKVLEQSENRSVGPELRRLFFETLEKIASGPFANYGEIISDYFFEDNLSDVPLVESDVCYMLNNMVNIVSGEESVYCKQRLQKRSHIDEGGTDDEPECKMMKNNEGEAVKCGKESGGSENEGGKVLKREKSKESEVSERENSRDNTDKSEDGNKKLVKKSASQESSSETLSDSDESSSDSDSSSGDSSSEENSNSDSSESSQDSSGGGDNEDDDKEPPKKKMKVTKEVEEVGNWKEEQRSLIDRCLCAMEECQRRFPEHYKSIYRQTYYYFHSKLRNDVNKVRDLLLNEGGLFADRRSTNFFNGVWRIPSSEIDRPGSFAGHMSRCLHLLLDLLRDSKDFKMLLSLALQLKDTPDPDKKYLRDTEREQLAREALSQCVQVLRNKLIEANNMSKLRLIVMEVFKAHRKISKLWPQREKTFNALLTQAYQKYLKFKGDNGNSNFEAASKFCLQEINQTGVTSGTVASSEETVTNNDAVTVSDLTVTVTPTTTTSGATITTVTPTTTVVPSETKVSTAPVLLPPSLPSFPPPPVKRPRGRPSNVSIRQQNPASFLKAAGIPTSKELQMMYQSLSYSKHQLPLMMPPNPLTAGLSLQQQINLQTEFLRQMTSQMAQVGGKNTKQNVPLPSMKPPSFLTEKSPKLPPTFPHSEKSSPKLLQNFPHGEKPSPKLLPNFPHGEKSSSKLLPNYPHGEKSSKLPPTFPQSEKSSKLPPTFPQSEKSSKLPPTFPQGEKSLKQYGKSSKTSSKHTSPHQSTYSKAASSVVQSVSQLRTNPGPVTSMSPSNAPPLVAQSLQHKLLSAKKAKMEKKSTMDPREILLGSSRDPMLGSSSSKLQSRSDVFSKGGRLNDDRFMSMNKSLHKSMAADTKSLLKDLTITPSGFNPDFGSAFSSALNKEDITLTRMPQGNESRIPDLASCSFVDSASKKIKSMFLPHVQPEKHQEPSWKPRAFEPRISSALAAIGTQLTITPTSSAMVHEKKQMAAPMQQMSSDVKYGKAEVSIEPVKEKPKIDPTVITIE